MAVDVWSMYEQLGEQDRASLSDVGQAVFAICDLRQEVSSGGFDAYLRYWGGNTAPQALASLADVLGQDWADLLGEAMALLGPAFPADSDARAELLDELELDGRLAELDERFYDLEAAVDGDALLSAWLRPDRGPS